MLLILFSAFDFKLYYLNNFLKDDLIELNHITYIKDLKSKSSEGFIGFFDWLRLDNDSICGIRMCFFDDLPYNNLVLSFPYIKSSFLNKYPEIFFKGNYYLSELSGDQDFTNNFVYKSTSGNYLFTFGVDHLTEKELTSLLIHCDVINL